MWVCRGGWGGLYYGGSVVALVYGGRGGCGVCGGVLFWVFGGDLWLVVWVIVVVVWLWWWWWLSFGGWLDLGCFVLCLGLGLGLMCE